MSGEKDFEGDKDIVGEDGKELNDYNDMYIENVKGFEDRLKVLGKKDKDVYLVGDKELKDIKGCIKRVFNIPEEDEIKILSDWYSGSAFIEGKIGGTIFVKKEDNGLKYKYDVEKGELSIGEVSRVPRNKVPQIINEEAAKIKDSIKAKAERLIEELPSYLQDFAKEYKDLADSNNPALEDIKIFQTIDGFPHELKGLIKLYKSNRSSIKER